FLVRVELVRGWRVAGVEGILGGIDGLFPGFQQIVAQHAVDQSTRDCSELQNLCERKGAAFGFKEQADALFLFADRWRSGRGSLPGDNLLHPARTAFNRFTDLDESAALQAG